MSSLTKKQKEIFDHYWKSSIPREVSDHLFVDANRCGPGIFGYRQEAFTQADHWLVCVIGYSLSLRFEIVNPDDAVVLEIWVEDPAKIQIASFLKVATLMFKPITRKQLMAVL